MTPIENMWSWIYTSVSNAVSTLNTIYTNSTMRPAFDILIVVIATGALLKFIILPLFGLSLSAGSDIAKKKTKETRDFVNNTHDAGDYF